jgi:hypothetical protein
VLGILATDPKYERRGAATSLIRWGIGHAAAEKMPIWIEATPTGYPLYQKLGWTVVDTQDLDLGGRYGAKQPDGQDWGADVAVEVLGPLAAGHYRTAMMRFDPVEAS